MMLQPKYVSRIPCKVPQLIVQQDGTVTYFAKNEPLEIRIPMNMLLYFKLAHIMLCFMNNILVVLRIDEQQPQ
ncbi:hypothetical protein QTP88_007548 [Uroleucon formosanum]